MGSLGLDCRVPGCGGNTIVVDSRRVPDGYIRRRRCLICEARFTTREIPIDDIDFARLPALIVLFNKLERLGERRRELIEMMISLLASDGVKALIDPETVP